MKTVRVPRSDNGVGAFRPCLPGGFEPNAGAAADDDKRLPGQLQFVTHGSASTSRPRAQPW